MTNRLVQWTVTLLMGVSRASLVAGEEEEKATPTEVTLHYDKPCDAQNKRLYIENAHTFRTYAVTVHWKAAGGKELTAQFYVEPGVMTEIGCAVPGAKIIEATPTEF